MADAWDNRQREEQESSRVPVAFFEHMCRGNGLVQGRGMADDGESRRGKKGGADL